MRLEACVVLCLAVGCSGVSNIHVCEPQCHSGQTCDLNAGGCRALTCETAADCGVPRFYECEKLAGATAKTCRLLQCLTDLDCQDTSFCNGVEECRPTDRHADAFGCTDPPQRGCPEGDVCDEVNDRCTPCVDADDDGARPISCGGDDCDDTNPSRFPGNSEVCDNMNVDEDCDEETFGYRDADGDHVVDDHCCNITRDGGRNCGDDCNDNATSVHPGASEVCNGFDDDCDGNIDFEVQIVVWPDLDHDGYGAADGGSVRICPDALGQGFSVYPNDCNDMNAAITPGAFICANPQVPSAIAICNSRGGFDAGSCGTRVCVTQPTGIGVCE